MKIKQQFIKKNNCYKVGRKITPKGIMVHSTATPGVLAASWYSRWNKSGLEVAVHAFVDDTVICQHLPWDYRAWHAAGDANNTHISFEMCEPKDWKTNKTYFKKCYENAVELAAYLCKQYNLKSSSIISHKEGYSKGIASNHGDPNHWWKNFGYDMDKFRADVDKLLKGEAVTASPKVTRATVKSGSKGSDVKYLQQRLNKMRTLLKLTYSKLTVDGIFGAKTAAAVKIFQKARKLTIDGIVGPKTWEALEVNYGDVNDDGKVDSVDKNLITKAISKLITLTSKQRKAADLNADGKITSADSKKI